MASSGSFNTSAYNATDGTRYLTFSWNEESQSVASNTTTISWVLKGGGTSKQWIYAGNFKVVIDGQTVYTKNNDNRIPLLNGTVIASGTFTFTHKDDGTRSFTASAEGGVYWHNVNCTGSATFSLNTIARASQPSLVTYPETTNDVGDFGVEFGIHMNRKSSAFTHTVRYEYGSRSGVIARDVETGVRWAVPLDFMNDIPNATSGSGRIYVDTYNGSTFVGTKYTGFTAKVPASVKPSCTIQVLDATDIQKTYGSLVKGLSKLYVKTNFYAAYSSPVTAYNVTANGVKYTEAEITTGVLTAAGTTTVTATVTDKRGRTSAAASASFPVLDYSPPKITAISVHRCNKDGTANDRGEFVEVVFSGEVTPLNNKNTAVYSVKYKKTSDDSWTTLTEDVNGWKPADLKDNYNVYNFSLVFAADGSSSYDVEVSVTDNHGTASRTTSASTAFTLINYHPEGNALRFGGVAEKENTFQNDLHFCQTGNRYSFQPEAFGGTKGYILLAVIKLNTLNVNAPIVFQINRRGALCPMNVYVRFASSSTTTDPDLGSITYEGDNFGAFMVKAATSTWKLYVDNTTGWSNPCLQDWFTTDNQMARMSIEFPSEIVEGTDPSVLGSYYRATPAVMRSIIDCLLPVGMIIQLYSHADPNTMYPGTTWVRMANTFLWGCDASGDIGITGGEKTHTLTVAELPTHTHGSVYSGNVDATKTHAWLASGGSSMAYGTIETGGGAAHNNMPPYTQVSIWRRTA